MGNSIDTVTSPSNPVVKDVVPAEEGSVQAISEEPAESEGTATQEIGEGAGDTTPTMTKPSKRSNVEELRSSLTQLGLDSTGKKDTLFKRLLKHFYRSSEPPPRDTASLQAEEAERAFEEKLAEAQENWHSFLCFDVEATCRGGKEFDWPNEIIEFPVVLLRWVDVPPADDGEAGPSRRPKRLEKIDTFHTYVKPTWQPVLSEFCTSLTGITQDMVDVGPIFPDMLKQLEMWLDKHDLRDEDGRLKNAAWVTDGPWDLRDFVPKQLHITKTDPAQPPYFFGQYLNIKQAVQTVLSSEWARDHPQGSASSFPTSPPKGKLRHGKHDTSVNSPQPPDNRYITTGKTMSKQFKEGTWKGPNYYFPIPGQLIALGLGDFEGRQHSGLDDATNIARILTAISEQPHVIIVPNARTHPNHARKWPWMGPEPGIVKFEEWMSIAKGTTLNGKHYGPKDDGKEKKSVEWQVKEDAAGRMKAVKVEISAVSTDSASGSVAAGDDAVERVGGSQEVHLKDEGAADGVVVKGGKVHQTITPPA